LRDEKVRWKLAGRFGTDAAVGVEKEDLVEVAKNMTQGIRADMVVEKKGLPLCNA
jgi:NADPH:quinone reductase-like Zn-dependent oxidoreductase